MLTIISFLFFLIIFVIIGGLSLIYKKTTNADYMLASNSIPPWLVGLSAMATNNSGYMFIGMIGFTYVVGISSIWLMVGWVLGDYFASLFVHRKLRISTEINKSLTYVGVLSQWHGNDYKILRAIGGLIVIVFLGTYAAAQLKAGSKALHVLFGWDYSVGATIGAAIVLFYCFAGGIRASIWTDAAQSFVMMIGMAIMLYISISAFPNVQEVFLHLDDLSPSYMSIFPQNLLFGKYFGLLLFVSSWLLAGFGVIGQPHIMVRFMTMQHPDDIHVARSFYYGWYTVFFILTIGVGLMSRLLIPDVNFDAELALPILAQKLLPEIAVGLVLAALFAATISTADSQILSCAASFTRDITMGQKLSYAISKIATTLATGIALCIALFGTENVFQLVLISWSVLAAAFAPLLTVYCLRGKPTQPEAVAMVFVGVGVTIAWRYAGLNNAVFEAGPGIIAGFMPYLLGLFRQKYR